MAHNIDTYIGRQAAWHNLGIVTGEYLTWHDIATQAHLDFQVKKEQFTHPRTGEPIPSWGIYRTDRDTFLGSVGSDYTPIPHQTGFQLIDHIMDNQGGAHYETAGALGLGEVVWGLADLNMGFETRGGDQHESYLLFVTSHDGSKPFMVRLTTTRVVCQNTLNLALSKKAQNAFRVKHTLNWKPRVENAMTILEEARRETTNAQELLDRLAHRQVTRESMEMVLDRLFPTPKGKGMSTKTKNNIVDILNLYESNDDNAIPEIRGTGLNLLNAITEYSDHHRATRVSKDQTAGKSEAAVTAIKDTARATSAMFGSGDEFKAGALKIILDAEGYMREVQKSVSVAVPALSAPTSQTVDTAGDNAVTNLLSMIDLGEEVTV